MEKDLTFLNLYFKKLQNSRRRGGSKIKGNPQNLMFELYASNILFQVLPPRMQLLNYLTSCWAFTENRDKMTTQLMIPLTRVRLAIYDRVQRNIKHDFCYGCCDWLIYVLNIWDDIFRQVRKRHEKTPVNGNENAVAYPEFPRQGRQPQGEVQI